VPQPYTRTVAASAPRTSTLVGTEETNQGWHGVIYFLNVTGDSGNVGETLQLVVEALDPASGNWSAVTNFATIPNSYTGTKQYQVFPSEVQTAAVTDLATQALLLPARWRVRVVHSGTGTWTYSLGEHAVV